MQQATATTFISEHLQQSGERRERIRKLEEGITELSAHIYAATFRLFEMICEYDECKGWAQPGLRSDGMVELEMRNRIGGRAGEGARGARAERTAPDQQGVSGGPYQFFQGAGHEALCDPKKRGLANNDRPPRYRLARGTAGASLPQRKTQRGFEKREPSP